MAPKELTKTSGELSITVALQEQRFVNSVYTANPKAMLKYIYECALFTALKLPSNK